MIVTIYANIAIFVQVFVGSVGYSIYCDIPTNTPFRQIFGQRMELVDGGIVVKIMNRKVFGEEISVIKIAWAPLYGKFSKANTVSYPMVAHRDSFGFANSKMVSSNACSAFIVCDEYRSLLRVT